MAMQSVKQGLYVVSIVVVADYISRIAMDAVPVEVKEMAEPAVNYMTEIYECSVYTINKMIGANALDVQI